jgi:hypothetical protein
VFYNCLFKKNTGAELRHEYERTWHSPASIKIQPAVMMKKHWNFSITVYSTSFPVILRIEKKSEYDLFSCFSSRIPAKFFEVNARLKRSSPNTLA